MSPNDSERKLLVKIGNYLAARTTAWVTYPDDEEVHIYAPGEADQVLTKGDTLDGGLVLPGFTLPLSKVLRT